MMLIIFVYVDVSFAELLRAIEEPSSLQTSGIASPPPLSSSFEPVDKKTAVAVPQSGFSQL